MSIRINGKKYRNGTVVRANPVEEVTGTLKKIGIGNDVYEIQGGGTSGGSAYTETVLWENAEGTTFYPQSPQTITLNDSIDNYDALLFDITTTESLEYHAPCICPVSAIIRNSNTMSGVYGIETQYTFSFKYSDTTHLILHGWASSYKLKAYKVTGIKYGGNLSPVIYSTEEREIGVWTNNKPLYQKTFIQQLSGNHTTIDISAYNMETATLVDGYYDTGVTRLSLNEHVAGAGDTYTHINIGANPPIIDCYNSIANNSTIYATVQYTKTTDVAGSGNYNTLGVPTVHYTTDEQVIGTWIDGKPIYQKSFIMTNSVVTNPNQWNIINDITSNDIDVVVNTQIYLEVDKSNNNFGFGKFENNTFNYFTTVQLLIKMFTIQYTKTTD